MNQGFSPYVIQPLPSSKIPATPPATRSSAQPASPSEDVGTPTPPRAENSAPSQLPHFSRAPAWGRRTLYPPPPDAPLPPHAPESDESARYRSLHRAR